MDSKLKLFMILLGCSPKGRSTEQHDVFFGIAEDINDLTPQMNLFWPEANGKLHIDVWREINTVGAHSIEVVENTGDNRSEATLYFLNLGGYKLGDFEEYHYKMLTVSRDLASAIKESKKTAFYKHNRFKGAASHIDEKYGIDVDDVHKISDLLNEVTKAKYQLKIRVLSEPKEEDELHIGYLKLKK